MMETGKSRSRSPRGHRLGGADDDLDAETLDLETGLPRNLLFADRIFAFESFGPFAGHNFVPLAAASGTAAEAGDEDIAALMRASEPEPLASEASWSVGSFDSVYINLHVFSLLLPFFV